MRLSQDTLVNLGSRALALILAIVFAMILIMLTGAPPLQALGLLVTGSVGSTRKIMDVIATAVPLLLATSGLLITFAAGLWNIGIEGQITIGAIFTTGVLRLFLDSSVAPEIVIVVGLIAGALGGALWASLAGVLKIYGGVNEIFSGLGLNFVATSVTIWLIFGPWRRPGVGSMSGTEPFPDAFSLPELQGFHLSPWSVVIAVAGIAFVYVLLRGTYVGLKLKAIGKNARASFILGVPTSQYTITAFALCGVLAGLAGAVQVLAVYHRLIPSISSGYGYLGLLVAMLVGSQVLLAIPVALFYAALIVGSIQLPIVLRLDSALAGVLQGALVLFVLLGDGVRQRLRERSEGGAMESSLLIIGLSGVIASAAPMIFAVLGETITEKGGVVNLSLNGLILLTAMAGFATAYTTGSVLLGFLAGAVIGAVVAAVVAFASITLRQSQIAIGFVLALMTRDLAYYLGSPYMGESGPRVPSQPIPVLSQIPIIGPLFFDHDLLVYASFILIIVTWLWVYRTYPGLVLQSIGERPAAAYVRGVNVNRQRYLYTIIGGALAGIAGPAYSLSVKAGWQGTISGLDGIGWIALAITIFGGWHPIRAAFGAYLFALLQWLSVVAQPVLTGIPSQVLQVAPFPLMILTLLLVNVGNTEWFRRRLAAMPDERRKRVSGLVRTLNISPPAALGVSFRKPR